MSLTAVAGIAIKSMQSVLEKSIEAKQEILNEREYQKTERLRIQEQYQTERFRIQQQAQVLNNALDIYGDALERAQKADREIQERQLEIIASLVSKDQIDELTYKMCMHCIDVMNSCSNVVALTQSVSAIQASITKLSSLRDSLHQQEVYMLNE